MLQADLQLYFQRGGGGGGGPQTFAEHSHGLKLALGLIKGAILDL